MKTTIRHWDSIIMTGLGILSLAGVMHSMAMASSLNAISSRTPAAYVISDEDAGYDQSKYDECMDSATERNCE